MSMVAVKAPEAKVRREVIITHSARETEEAGRRLAEKLSAGDVLALTGELGAGKTCFTRGIARGLGIKGYVKSPSFVMVHVHDKGGRLPLYHIDLYRVAGPREAEELGLEEYIYGDGVSVIEWAERGGGILPEDAVRIDFFHEGGTERRIEIEGDRDIFVKEGQ